MSQVKTRVSRIPLAVQQYGLAVLCVAVALGVNLTLANLGIVNLEFPIFMIAIAITSWYGGTGPAILTLVASSFAFNYYFTEPRYSFYVTKSDLPYFVVFILFAIIIIWFSVTRRRIEQTLRASRDRLQIEVDVRIQREDEIKGLNQELLKSSSNLEVMNRELEAFAYSISHDLRAPLRHMVGYTELLQKNSAASVDDKGRRYISMILESAKRMGTLIDDLLSFSRIGRAETRETMVNLNQVVQEIQNEVWREIEGRTVTWKVQPLPDVYGDRSMLKVALLNLISNAVKFTSKEPAAEIDIGVTDTKNDYVVFIKDNGVGFEMKYVDKLFGVFQRLHKMNEFEGTGIGLATVQRIILRHGGRVWAESEVGSGATFYLSLPKP